MPNPDQLKALDERERSRKRLQNAYKGERDGLVLTDLLSKLDEWYARDYQNAIKAKENPYLSTSLLQSANAFDIVRSYILDLSK